MSELLEHVEDIGVANLPWLALRCVGQSRARHGRNRRSPPRQHPHQPFRHQDGPPRHQRRLPRNGQPFSQRRPRRDPGSHIRQPAHYPRLQPTRRRRRLQRLPLRRDEVHRRHSRVVWQRWLRRGGFSVCLGRRPLRRLPILPRLHPSRLRDVSQAKNRLHPHRRPPRLPRRHPPSGASTTMVPTPAASPNLTSSALRKHGLDRHSGLVRRGAYQRHRLPRRSHLHRRRCPKDRPQKRSPDAPGSALPQVATT